ncbi:MAG: peptide-binding protein [Chitinophagales bacterium]|nr:MAG: peptide-binding protein [Chitinophagales bacterium]
MKKFTEKVMFGIGLVAVLVSCNSGSNTADTAVVQSKRAGVNEVIIHEIGNPDKLNPILSTSANSSFIEGEMFMSLLAIDPDSFTYLPMLARSRPVIQNVEEGEYAGGQTITYELRPEAVWDNGEPVTAYDVEFTLKTIKNPHVDCPHLRPYYEFIGDMKIDEQNPRKFTFFCKDRYFMSEIWSGLTVYPEYVYDPERIMRNFTVKELDDPKNLDKIKSDPRIIRFAQQFNSEKYQREKGFVVGCGPYEFDSWVTNQRIILKRKPNWWGDKLKGVSRGFEANPQKLIYEIITDHTTALTALKDEGIDVMRAFKPKDFVDLQKDPKATKLFNLESPLELSYVYIGLNMKNPKLEDVRVRKALAHMVDTKYIIDVLFYGLGERTIGPIHPSQSYYHKGITPYAFDLDKAAKLLEEAGWVDSDGDGIRDKVINGVKTPLKLEYKYSQGSATGENVGLMLKEKGKKVGVDFSLLQREWTVFIEDNKNHNFEMFYGAWIAAPTLTDLKQIWHTESYNRGSNYVGFGNEETDELIEKIRYELNEEVRNQMYYKIQEIIHDQVPYIFLLTPKNKLAIHKRFDNAGPKVARPGYVVDEFRLNPNFGVRAVAAN